MTTSGGIPGPEAGTYEVQVGRVLALDTAVLPGTHFEVGDGFNPGLVVSPPITAEIEVRIQHMPHSDISQFQERVIRGRTNRFGYFQPAGNTRGLRAAGRVPGGYYGARRGCTGAALDGFAHLGRGGSSRHVPLLSPTDDGALMHRTRLGHSGSSFDDISPEWTSLLISRFRFQSQRCELGRRARRCKLLHSVNQLSRPRVVS